MVVNAVLPLNLMMYERRCSLYDLDSKTLWGTNGWLRDACIKFYEEFVVPDVKWSFKSYGAHWGPLKSIGSCQVDGGESAVTLKPYDMWKLMRTNGPYEPLQRVDFGQRRLLRRTIPLLPPFLLPLYPRVFARSLLLCKFLHPRFSLSEFDAFVLLRDLRSASREPQFLVAGAWSASRSSPPASRCHRWEAEMLVFLFELVCTRVCYLGWQAGVLPDVTPGQDSGRSPLSGAGWERRGAAWWMGSAASGRYRPGIWGWTAPMRRR